MPFNIDIFDSLVHVTKDGKWFDTPHNASIEKLLENSDVFNKALLVGLPGNDLQYLLEVTGANPEKFIPIAPFELCYKNSLEKSFKQLKQRGFKGIKIHPRLLNTNLADSCIIEAIQCAHQQELITLLCTIHRSPSPPIKNAVSEILYDICFQTRGAKLILLHGGYYDLLATSEMIRSFENVLLDLSGTLMRFQHTHLRDTMAFLFETLDRKLCIGSDFPEYTINDVKNCIENTILFDKNLHEEKIHNIFYANLNRLVHER